mmetsp:Transcript_35678/g.60319  ORF Transcript_35678/g.60319 Transcript_35678/m.60319 type:complete len:257 (+) Transcript_35678:1502-2272(+)
MHQRRRRRRALVDRKGQRGVILFTPIATPLHAPAAAAAAAACARRPLVLKVHHLRDPRLDEELATFVAREHGDVDGAAAERGPVLVHDGVHLRVAYVRVLGLQLVPVPALLRPRQARVGAVPGEAVVAYAQNHLVDPHDARPYLLVGVLAAQAREKGHGHKVVVPREVLLARTRVEVVHGVAQLFPALLRRHAHVGRAGHGSVVVSVFWEAARAPRGGGGASGILRARRPCRGVVVGGLSSWRGGGCANKRYGKEG